MPGRKARQERGQPALADLVRACGSVGLRGEEAHPASADRRTGGPEDWQTGEPADRRVRARALQRNAPELPWRPSSARRR